jgi:hypothetical protein
MLAITGESTEAPTPQLNKRNNAGVGTLSTRLRSIQGIAKLRGPACFSVARIIYKRYRVVKSNLRDLPDG